MTNRALREERLGRPSPREHRIVMICFIVSIFIDASDLCAVSAVVCD